MRIPQGGCRCLLQRNLESRFTDGQCCGTARVTIAIQREVPLALEVDASVVTQMCNSAKKTGIKLLRKTVLWCAPECILFLSYSVDVIYNSSLATGSSPLNCLNMLDREIKSSIFSGAKPPFLIRPCNLASSFSAYPAFLLSLSETLT